VSLDFYAVETYASAAKMPFTSLPDASPGFYIGVPQKLSAEGARIEAPKAPRGMGIGEEVSPSPTN